MLCIQDLNAVPNDKVAAPETELPEVNEIGKSEGNLGFIYVLSLFLFCILILLEAMSGVGGGLVTMLLMIFYVLLFVWLCGE